MGNILKPADMPPTDPNQFPEPYREGKPGWEYGLDWEYADTTKKRIEVLRRVKTDAPYRLGDVIWTLDSDGRPRAALVVRVFYERLPILESIVPKYRVALLRKDGKAWSRRWQYSYPGMIGRAYEAIKPLAS